MGARWYSGAGERTSCALTACDGPGSIPYVPLGRKRINKYGNGYDNEEAKTVKIEKTAVEIGKTLALVKDEDGDNDDKTEGGDASERVSDDSIWQQFAGIPQAFKARCSDKKNWPKLVVIALNQLYNTKFYPTEQEIPVEVSSNVIVDRHITGYMMRDCYLQAHTRAHGPAIPVRDVVTRDECDIPADALEAFTNSLHYIPTRLTKATSVATPVDYATLLCDRGRN
ncbi:hypothetical protein LTS10_013022 [Elasticomyces elasticus]|nr:hypothetical protein LTS10_013022 [Elasticomyces elasticus]